MHTVRDLCAAAFAHAGLDWQQYVKVDPKFVRPAEVDVLRADASRARKELGWTPKVSFEQLVQMMVDADLRSEEHTSELQSLAYLVCRLLLEKKKLYILFIGLNATSIVKPGPPSVPVTLEELTAAPLAVAPLPTLPHVSVQLAEQCTATRVPLTP